MRAHLNIGPGRPAIADVEFTYGSTVAEPNPPGNSVPYSVSGYVAALERSVGTTDSPFAGLMMYRTCDAPSTGPPCDGTKPGADLFRKSGFFHNNLPRASSS